MENDTWDIKKIPKKYRNWKNSLSEYRSYWRCIKSKAYNDVIAIEHMSFDYLKSLYSLLNPEHTFEECHILICIRQTCSIVEAVLLYKLLQPLPLLPPWLTKQLKGMHGNEVLKKTKKLLDKELYTTIQKLFDIRNNIHLSKKANKNNSEKETVSIEELDKCIESLRKTF